jgi:hypothetical protein
MEHKVPQNYCSYCGGNLIEVIDLGFLPPVNVMPSSNQQNEPNIRFPLSMHHCEKCALTQIAEELSPDVVFPESYPYLSGTTRILRDNFAEQATTAIPKIGLNRNHLVVDIGSNDGTLLGNYIEVSRVLGVEPTNAADVAIAKNIPTIKGFFNLTVSEKIVSEFGKAKLVTACNVFAHIPNLDSLMRSILNILDEEGVFLSESHYLCDLVESLQFDTIYHEHLRYYDSSFLSEMFRQYGLEIFDIERIKTHGGSIRVWAARQGTYAISENVEKFLLEEQRSIYHGINGLHKFSTQVTNWRHEFRKLIAELKLKGSSIAGIGAPSRASTLISFVGLEHSDLMSIGEIANSHKIGRNMPGTNIPIIDEKVLIEIDPPDYLLILSWHIAGELIEKIKAQGYKGKYIIPLPHPIIIA